MTSPDKYTAQYLIGQVVGFGHLLNGLKAEQAAQNETIDALRKEIVQLRQARDQDQAAIGELRSRYDRLVARLTEKFKEKQGAF